MTAAVDGWADGYEAARRALSAIPGPMLRAVAPRLLAVSDDPSDDPAYTDGYRQALRDASGSSR